MLTRKLRYCPNLKLGATELKVLFSRKGFNTTWGGAPSPIVDDMPISLPIPTSKYPSASTYEALGLGHILSKVRTKITANHLCHKNSLYRQGGMGAPRLVTVMGRKARRTASARQAVIIDVIPMTGLAHPSPPKGRMGAAAYRRMRWRRTTSSGRFTRWREGMNACRWGCGCGPGEYVGLWM